MRLLTGASLMSSNDDNRRLVSSVLDRLLEAVPQGGVSSQARSGAGSVAVEDWTSAATWRIC